MTEGVTLRKGRLMPAEDSKYYFYCKTFWYSTVIACLITIPFIIYEWVVTGHGIYLYYGDYNAQQIAFYKHCVEMVRSGNFGWDWFTDMGSNFVGSYSYYMLGSPFFWIMCLFPSSWAPYLMGPMYIIKYVVAALIAYAYLQRWVKNKDYAVLGALLYAFCGFQIYNTFFNQFHEVVALFPLLLIGMEEYIQNGRKGIFAIAVCLNAMVNYFMFAGQVMFCVIYFMFRFSDRSFRVTVKKFFGLALEAVIGFAMSMILFLPGALALLGNDRTSRFFSAEDWEKMLAWFKNGELYWQRYGQILESYFFPPDIPSRVNFFFGHTERWASISAYLPLFGLTGVFAFYTTKKRGWLKALIPFLVICSFVPVLNSIFFLGNSSYYARWMYLMVLMMVIATIIALDRKDTRWKGAITASLLAIAAIAVPLGLLWYDEPSSDAVDYQLGRAPFLVRFWIYTAIAVAGVLLVWYVIKHFRGTKLFARALLVTTSLCIVVYGCVHIINGKEHSHTSDFMVHQVINGEDVVLPDAQEDFYRIDFYRTSSLSTIDNLNIYWGYPSIECFHTVVPPSLMNFYDLLGYNRSVGSRTYSSWYGLRAMTSTEYSFIQTTRNKRKVKTLYEDKIEDLEEILELENDSDWTLVEKVDSVRIYQKGDEVVRISLYDPDAVSEYENSKLWKQMESIDGFRLFSAKEIGSDGMETTAYHLVEISDTETISRLENDPSAKEITLSQHVRLYEKDRAGGKVVYTQVDVTALPELEVYFTDDAWSRWEQPEGFVLLHNETTNEYRLLSEAEDADQILTLLAAEEWTVCTPSENLLVFCKDTEDGVLYEAVDLPSLESLASYEAGAGYTRVVTNVNFRIFASLTEKETYRLVAKDDAYNLEYYGNHSDWTELVVDETHRVYCRTRSSNDQGKLYAVGSLYNTEELEKYENDPAWSFVEEKVGYRTYSSEEFNMTKGWYYYDTQNGYDIYRNENHLSMGFSYDGFMTETEFKKISSGFQRSVLLCTYLVVPDDMADYYAQFMDEYVDDPNDEGNKGKLKRKAANYNTFTKSVEERKTMSCTDFTWSSDGFSAKYSSDETDIVFFSVPAEGGWYNGANEGVTGLLTGTGGWTATVDGKEVEILTVFGGFMAVEVPAGENVEIVFTYKTFGSGLGTGITVCAILAFAVYMFLLYKKKQHRGDYPFFEGTYYDAGDTEALPAEDTVGKKPAKTSANPQKAKPRKKK